MGDVRGGVDVGGVVLGVVVVMVGVVVGMVRVVVVGRWCW